jgi:hypothetical protein
LEGVLGARAGWPSAQHKVGRCCPPRTGRPRRRIFAGDGGIRPEVGFSGAACRVPPGMCFRFSGAVRRGLDAWLLGRWPPCPSGRGSSASLEVFWAKQEARLASFARQSPELAVEVRQLYFNTAQAADQACRAIGRLRARPK